jgi:TolB protein
MSLKNFILFALILSYVLSIFSAQCEDIILRPTPGEEIILAVADIQPTAEDTESELAGLIETFNQVLWADLRFSGFFTLADKSFYPIQPAVALTEKNIPYDAWDALPGPIAFLSSGILDIQEGILQAELNVFDMKQRKWMFGQIIPGDKDHVRAIAHRWADEIVYRLSAGASKGIASTKVAYTSVKGDAREIYVMDYDGYNSQAFTRNGSLNLFPKWSPDNSKLIFLNNRTGHLEINIYSFIDGSRLPFPIFNTFTNTPAIDPDGKRIVFALRATLGDADLFVADLDGSNLRNITNNPAIDTSPAWSPSGRKIAFVSDRGGGAGQIYICDADGANIQRIVTERGDADNPAWSPDGQWLAFHWKPPMRTYYDLFIAQVSNGRIYQLTTDSGSNENASWAPDGKHLVFQSDRTGTNQIYIMRLDGRELRRVTHQGNNTNPAWSGYFYK